MLVNHWRLTLFVFVFTEDPDDILDDAPGQNERHFPKALSQGCYSNFCWRWGLGSVTVRYIDFVLLRVPGLSHCVIKNHDLIA